MATLVLNVGANSIELTPREANGFVDYYDTEWQYVLRKFFYFACEHRALCIISSDEPTVVSDLPNARKVAMPKKKWYQSSRWIWFAYTRSCTRQILDEIWQSGEFQLGPLFVTSIENVNPERVLQFYRVDRRIDDGREQLYGGNDGVIITWINPPDELKLQFESVLRAIAEKVGWQIIVERT